MLTGPKHMSCHSAGLHFDCMGEFEIGSIMGLVVGEGHFAGHRKREQFEAWESRRWWELIGRWRSWD